MNANNVIFSCGKATQVNGSLPHGKKARRSQRWERFFVLWNFCEWWVREGEHSLETVVSRGILNSSNSVPCRGRYIGPLPSCYRKPLSEHRNGVNIATQERHSVSNSRKMTVQNSLLSLFLQLINFTIHIKGYEYCAVGLSINAEYTQCSKITFQFRKWTS